MAAALRGGNSFVIASNRRRPASDKGDAPGDSTISENSPRNGIFPSDNAADNSDNGMSSICSCAFVNSRPTTARALSPRNSRNSDTAFSMRRGDSNSIIFPASSGNCSKKRRRAAGALGAKPIKCTAPSRMPAADIIAVSALAPGSGDTAHPAARTARAKRAPGSLTPGAPASDK